MSVLMMRWENDKVNNKASPISRPWDRIRGTITLQLNGEVFSLDEATFDIRTNVTPSRETQQVIMTNIPKQYCSLPNGQSYFVVGSGYGLDSCWKMFRMSKNKANNAW